MITTHLHHGGHVGEHGESEPPAPVSDAVSLKSSASNKKKKLLALGTDAEDDAIVTPSTNGNLLTVGSTDKNAASAEDVSRLGEGLEQLRVEVQEELDDPDQFEDAEEGEEGVKVVFLTEQISHHPPASSYYFACPEKGVEAAGVDQISAKVSGTSKSNSLSRTS